MRKRFIAIVGCAMGLAEVVPGVSGGTIAFVSGIYERLIQSIKNVDKIALQYLFQGKFRAFAVKIDLSFLVLVLAGMFAGLVAGVFGISYLLDHHPVAIWSFFFGLILASSVYLGFMIESWNIKVVVALMLGAASAYLITIQSPSGGQDAVWAYFLSGVVAISAMILPGISGSFILLLLGMYPLVLAQARLFLSTLDLTAMAKIGVFGLGAVLGLALFSRLLSWLFGHYKNITYAILTGFIIGSLNKVWPWKHPVLGQDKSGKLVELTGLDFDPEKIRIIREENLSPFHASIEQPHVALAILMFLIGVLLIYLLARVEDDSVGREKREERREKREEKRKDI